MKITAIGDIHGRTGWKEIVKTNMDSLIIFLGDYLDQYSGEGISEDDCINNFIEIIEFKKNNSNVILLTGNHDYQYLYYPNGATDRVTRRLKEILKLFRDNINLFQFAYQKGEYLFTHAGITNDWLNEYKYYLSNIGLDREFSNLGDIINKAGTDADGLDLLCSISRFRGGYDLNGGPLWADINELYDNYLDDFHQIVGHNKQNYINTVGDSTSSITYCDSLEYRIEGYILDI